MDLGEGWNQPDSVTRQVLELDRLYSLAPSGTRVSVAPLYEGLSRQEQDTVYQDLNDFHKNGLIDLADCFTYEDADCVVTAHGARYIEAIRKQRDDVIARRKTARDAVLRYLFAAKVGNNNPSDVADFLATPYSIYLGVQFTKNEFDDAVDWLLKAGLINGTKTFGGHLLRPSITHEGDITVESGRSVSDPKPEAGSTTTVNVTGHGNAVQAGSAGATQTVTITMSITDDHRQQTLNLAKAIEEASGALGPEAAELPSELRAAVEAGQDDPGVLKKALAKANTVLMSGATSALGKLLLQGSTGLLHHYGIDLPSTS